MQAQPGCGRGTHKLLSTSGAKRVSKTPPLQRAWARIRCMGPARTLADAGGAGRRGQRTARLTTWVTQVLCSGEPLTTTHGGSIVILSRENLRARTHHSHQPCRVLVLTQVRRDRRRASITRVRAAQAFVVSTRPAARRNREQRAAAPPACVCIHVEVPIFGITQQTRNYRVREIKVD